MPSTPHPAGPAIHILPVLQAVADETRLAVVVLLARRWPRTSGCLADTLGVAPSTLSRHLRVLKQAGVVVTKPEGNRRWARLRREELDRRYPGPLDAVIRAAEANNVAGGYDR